MLTRIRSKLSILWHVFRGRPLVYRVTIEGEVIFPGGVEARIAECTFTAPEPPPVDGLLNFIPECGFFKVATSSCLRPVVALVQSLERGTLWVCDKHGAEQGERDRHLRSTLQGLEDDEGHDDVVGVGDDPDACYLGICHTQAGLEAALPIEEEEAAPHSCQVGTYPDCCYPGGGRPAFHD